MGKGRLEAFSDGVIAIIITIMVLEFHVPEAPTLEALSRSLPHLAIYALSFAYVGIYWNNHHHMFHATRAVNGAILWANLHLLFWLSLVPFTSAWMGEHDTAPLPVGLYGANLLMTALAYTLLEHLLIRHEGQDSALAKALSRNGKEWFSLAAYIAAIAVCPWYPPASLILYAAVALVWLVPDLRIERMVKS